MKKTMYFTFLLVGLLACQAPTNQKTEVKETTQAQNTEKAETAPKASPLEDYLKTIPEKKLPFVLDNQFKGIQDVSEQGFEVLYTPQDANMIKQGQNFGVTAQVLFWYQLEGGIVGVVTASGAQIKSYALTTFQRKTGKRVATAILGAASSSSMATRYKSTCSFEKNGNITVKTTTTTTGDNNTTEETKTFLVGKSGEITPQ